MSQHDPLAEAEAIGTRLLDATHEARAAIRDLRTVIAEAKAAADDVRAAASDVVDKGLDEAVAAGLASYHDAIGGAIEKSTAAVYKRFDTLADILLGEDRQSKAKARPSLAELAELRRKTS